MKSERAQAVYSMEDASRLAPMALHGAFRTWRDVPVESVFGGESGSRTSGPSGQLLTQPV